MPRISKKRRAAPPAVSIDDTTLSTWFERDRAYVGLMDSHSGETIIETIIEWWDDDVAQAVEHGFLAANRGERKLHESAYEYAIQMGIIRRL